MLARTIDGIDIHYEVTGAGPAVILVHGIADSSADWGDVPTRLAAHRTVVTLDLRGHGRSGRADDYSSLVMAQDVLAVVEAAGLDRPLFVGHGLGAVAVSAASTQVACRGVVNIDQFLRFDRMIDLVRPVADEVRMGDLPRALRHVFDGLDEGLTPEPHRTRLLANRDTFPREVVLGVWDILMRSTPAEMNAMTGVVGARIAVPYLAIYGTTVPDDYPGWLVERVPAATVELWPGVGHYPHLADTDRFVARVVEFDDALEPT